MENYNSIQDLLQIDEADPELENEDAAPEQEAAIIENEMEKAQIAQTLKLDYKLKTCEERADLVNRIVAQTPKEQLTNRYLEILGDYIMGGLTKEEKRGHTYLTSNRRLTIDRRETSFEGLAEKFENGEDGIYQLMTNDKNIIFQHKQEITQEDINTIPGLKELRDAIKQVEEAGKVATGRKKYLLKKQLIEMRKDQYILKNCAKPSIYIMPTPRGLNKIDLSERRYVDENGDPQSTGLISFFKPEHISAILCHYNALQIEVKGRYWDDFYYLMKDFDELMERALRDYPAYLDIVRYKVDGKTNFEIQQMLLDKYSIQHTVQYISQLWRTKIPKIIAEREQHDFLLWHSAQDPSAPMKKCACCGQRKPANSRFFSHNKTSKDGWYSWCKMCRNKKNAENKIKKL